jgi:hypothetical protein
MRCMQVGVLACAWCLLGVIRLAVLQIANLLELVGILEVIPGWTARYCRGSSGTSYLGVGSANMPVVWLAGVFLAAASDSLPHLILPRRRQGPQVAVRAGQLPGRALRARQRRPADLQGGADQAAGRQGYHEGWWPPHPACPALPSSPVVAVRIGWAGGLLPAAGLFLVPVGLACG